MDTTVPIQDQLANISPVWIVAIVAVFTLVRVALAKSQDAWARTISETCDTINFVLILAFLLIRPFIAQAFYIPSESMQDTLLVGDRLIVNKFQYRFSEPQRGDVIVFEAPSPRANPRPGVDYIKRLIGKPGDTIQVTAAQLFIDDEEIDVHTEAANLHEYLNLKLGLDRNRNSIKIFSDYLLINHKEKISKERLAELLGRPGAKIRLVPGQTIRNGTVLNEPYTREDPDYNYPGDGSALKLNADEYFVMGDNRNQSHDSHAWGPLDRSQVVGKAIVTFLPPTRIGPIK